MDFKLTLRDFQREFNPALAAFFDTLEPRAKSISPAVLSAFQLIKDFSLQGGKRLRPLLMKWAYEGYGGDEPAKILRAAGSIELMQSFLLIHDDIMDRSDLRRGGPTAHKSFEAEYRTLNAPDPEHLGASLAIIAGDTAMAYGALALSTAELPVDRTVRALHIYSEIVVDETFGQILDMRSEIDRNLDESGALDVFYYKTTRYTIEGPLHLGAVLAGAPDAELEKLSAFAVPVGNAFQLQDDILGLFGDQAKLGKPVGSDVKEGKQTLLMIRALATATETQAETLRDALGNPDLKAETLEDVQGIIETTGSLAYAKQKVSDWVDEAKSTLSSCGASDQVKKRLSGLADYLVERDF